MMSNVTLTSRLCAIMMSRAMWLHSIMHNDDMQVLRSLARLVHNPHRVPVYTRRDLVRIRYCMCNRDRNRRT